MTRYLQILNYVLVLVAVLLYGCDGRKNKHQDEPSPADTTRQHSPGRTDTIPTVVPQAQDAITAEYDVQADTANTVELSIFKRKEIVYKPEQLVGEWVQGTLHEVYFDDGTGLQWNTVDDVSREEAQSFTWTLEGNDLRQVFTMELGGVVPRTYFVTFVDDESLVYKDDFGNAFMWDKQNQ